MRGKRAAQVWDKMEAFSRPYNNHHIYCIITLSGRISEAIMQRALQLSLSAFPILKSKYIENAFSSYWRESDGGEVEGLFCLAEAADPEEELAKFYRDEIDPWGYGQIRLKLIRCENNDILCVAVNHMICDAAGFKEYLYVLSDIYTKLCRDKDHAPDTVYDGDRSAAGLYFDYIRDLPALKKKWNVLFRAQKHNHYDDQMPLPPGGQTSPRIFTRTLSGQRFTGLKSYAKSKNLTINDIFLAAFLRTLSIYLPAGHAMKIPCMVDLRRFQKDKKLASLTNLTSTLVVDIGDEIGCTFEDTAQKVHVAVRNLLDDFRSLDGYLYLLAAFLMLPYRMVQNMIMKHFHSFPIAYSNLGVIDKDKLQFGDLETADCFMTGSIKKKPCFWLAISTFADRLTISINLDASREDAAFIEEFLMRMEDCLPV